MLLASTRGLGESEDLPACVRVVVARDTSAPLKTCKTDHYEFYRLLVPAYNVS